MIPRRRRCDELTDRRKQTRPSRRPMTRIARPEGGYRRRTVSEVRHRLAAAASRHAEAVELHVVHHGHIFRHACYGARNRTCYLISALWLFLGTLQYLSLVLIILCNVRVHDVISYFS